MIFQNNSHNRIARMGILFHISRIEVIITIIKTLTYPFPGLFEKVYWYPYFKRKIDGKQMTFWRLVRNFLLSVGDKNNLQNICFLAIIRSGMIRYYRLNIGGNDFYNAAASQREPAFCRSWISTTKCIFSTDWGAWC